jgi:hypothetical protein
MFPHIQGLLAFDTPFLGMAPGVVSHGAEEHYKTATTAYTTFTEVAGLFGIGGNKATGSNPAASTRKATAPLPLPAATSDGASGDAAATPSWQRWGRYAMFAGAAGAVAAGGAAALYSQRDRFTEGWGWVTSHLEFVGCLARPGDLRTRVASLAKLRQDRGICSINFYTCLGKAAPTAASSNNTSRSTSSLILRIPRAKARTFCHLPEDFDPEDIMLAGNVGSPGLRWITATNDKAGDETAAHISMFTPRDNPGYYDLAHDAAETIVEWVDKGWYASATTPSASQPPKQQDEEDGGPQNDNGFMEDDVIVLD